MSGNPVAIRTIHTAPVQPDPSKSQHNMAAFGNARANPQPRLPQTTHQVTSGNYIWSTPQAGALHGQIAAYNTAVPSNAYVTQGQQMHQPVFLQYPQQPPMYYIRQPWNQARPVFTPANTTVPTSVPQPGIIVNQPYLTTPQSAPQTQNKPRKNALKIVNPDTKEEVKLPNSTEPLESVIAIFYNYSLL